MLLIKAIFLLKKLIEKFLAMENVHSIFIDLEEAYDGMPKKFWRVDAF